jgi:ankyrin repeat protein
MIASAKGLIDFVEILLLFRADMHLKSFNGMNAIDWAKRYSRNEVVQLLECYKLDYTNFY